MTRAVRNNNPLNLRISANKWLGKVSPSQDKEFETFETWVLGLRAGLINIRTHVSRGVNTIDKLINVWAPSNENDTENYIQFVSDQSGILRNSPIGFEIETIRAVVKAMVKIESGKDLTDKEFMNAWSLLS